jgi:two-component system chemotaxis response regulator CheB
VPWRWNYPRSAREEQRRPVRASGEGLVVVGTSTGGPPALEALLAPLPANFPWPIVVAQHMPGTFTGALARRLDTLSALSIVEVARTVQLQAGCAYIGKGDADVVIGRRPAGLVAVPVRSDSNYPWHPSTDRLVKSAMEHVAPRQIVGILMTGMGRDGAAAMASLHAAGGCTIAEAQETAVVWGMPGELVEADGADWVLPLPEIAGWLRSWCPDMPLVRRPTPPAEPPRAPASLSEGHERPALGRGARAGGTARRRRAARRRAAARKRSARARGDLHRPARAATAESAAA